MEKALPIMGRGSFPFLKNLPRGKKFF